MNAYLHAKEEPEAFTLTLLIQVTVSRQEESLATQVKGLRIDSSLREKCLTLVNFQIKINKALI
jgi:hypothetical protein